MKLTLKEMIKNEINNSPRGYISELAKVSGYSQAGALTKVLEKEEKEFENFIGLINLVKYIWGNDSLEIMVDYSKQIDPNKKCARNFLEYLSINRKFDDLIELLDKMDSCKNKESQEFAKLYRMLHQYELANEEEMSVLTREISNVNVNIYELKVFKKMLLNYCYTQLNDFTMVKILSKEIDSEVELIENNYIKEMYLVRSSQIMSYNYLIVFNDGEKARQCTNNIINSEMAEDTFKAYAYYIKGLSYQFTSHEKTISNLMKSMSMWIEQKRDNNVNEIKELIEFVNVYWGVHKEESCKHIKNEIFLKIKKGEDATNYLVNSKGKIEKEFHLFLEGCNSNNTKKLMLSLIKYMKKNDLFSANMVKIELLKNGYDEEILEELIGVDVSLRGGE